MKNTAGHYSLFLLSFILWIFSFRGFLSGELVLTGDAVPYYEHFKYMIDSLNRGVYPMWDPTRNWGAPNEFFLRRIGSYNPFILGILILYKTGLPYISCYFSFLAFCYLSGMMGFYFLAKTIFHERQSAFVAYLFLTFSSVSTLLFDSFLILSFSPMIWFFYCLISFMQEPRRVTFLGMIFTLMIMLSTYLPFYFFTIVIVFMGLLVLLYFPLGGKILIGCLRFMRQNKLFIFFSMGALLLSFLPGLLFFQEAERGELVMPVRHKDSMAINFLEVVPQTYMEGGIMVPTMRNELFSDLKDFRSGVLYIPPFVHILFLLGIITPLSRRLSLLAVMMFIFYLIGLYDATPVYQFLYDHIFYFKYMRNLQYFLWLVLVPAYILGCSEQFRILWARRTYVQQYQLGYCLFFIGLHIAFGIFLSLHRGMILSSYGITGVSLLFFILYILGWRERQGVLGSQTFGGSIFPLILFVLIVWQPLEVYHYLGQNAKRRNDLYRYDRPYFRINFLDGLIRWDHEKKKTADYLPIQPRQLSSTQEPEPLFVWYGTKWVYTLQQHMHPRTLEARYFHNAFIVYDRVEWISESTVDWSRLEKAITQEENVAFVIRPEDKQPMAPFPLADNISPEAQLISMDSTHCEVIDFDANYLKLKTNYSTAKFFVYNDSYYRGWGAYVNGEKTDIWRANIAFKGIWLPPGENVVLFRFESTAKRWFHILMIGVFYITFFYLMILCVRAWRCQKNAR